MVLCDGCVGACGQPKIVFAKALASFSNDAKRHNDLAAVTQVAACLAAGSPAFVGWTRAPNVSTAARRRQRHTLQRAETRQLVARRWLLLIGIWRWGAVLRIALARRGLLLVSWRRPVRGLALLRWRARVTLFSRIPAVA